MNLRPMLAGKAPEDLNKLHLPIVASPKLDGIRCLIVNGQPVSRTLKPIPNQHIQRLLSRPEFEGLDGELIVGSPSAPNCMQTSMSGVMSYDGEPDFRFYVFDRWDRGKAPFWPMFSQRDFKVPLAQQPDFLLFLHHELVSSIPALESIEASVLSAGYEGVILRQPTSPYKFNRSTTKEQWLLKLKRHVTSEARVIDTEPLLHNANAAELDERGYTKRSTHQDGKVELAMLGALVCQLPSGITFNIGTGFTEFERVSLWRQRKHLPGRIVTFKHFAQQGVKDRPRHPVFVAFRDPRDL